DQPPRHHDLLVGGTGPFEIRHGDLAVHALVKRVEEFRRGQPDDVALTLQRLLVGVHGVGHVDRDHELDVNVGGGGGLAPHLCGSVIDPAAAAGQRQSGDHRCGGTYCGENHPVCAHRRLRT